MNSDHNHLSRRQMLSRSAVAAGWLALSPAFAPLLAGGTGRRFKIGACEWSLHKSDPSSLDVAKQIGLDGAQISLGSLADNLHLRQPAVQAAYRDASQKTSVQISSLALTELNNVPLKNDPRAEQWVADTIGVLQAMNLKIVLVPAFGKADLFDDRAGIDHTVEVLKRVAPRAEKAGVILGLENYLSAAENLDLINRIGSPAVQVYYDVGNSTDKGYDVYQEIRTLKGRICEFHAKDGKFMLGQGRIDFQKVRAAMDDIQFSGWIQIEAAVPHNLIGDYQEDAAFLRHIFNV